jgi:hypothetical protein
MGDIQVPKTSEQDKELQMVREAMEQYRHRLQEMLKQVDESFWTAVERRARITLKKYKNVK